MTKRGHAAYRSPSSPATAGVYYTLYIYTYIAAGAPVHPRRTGSGTNKYRKTHNAHDPRKHARSFVIGFSGAFQRHAVDPCTIEIRTHTHVRARSNDKWPRVALGGISRNESKMTNRGAPSSGPVVMLARRFVDVRTSRESPRSVLRGPSSRPRAVRGEFSRKVVPSRGRLLHRVEGDLYPYGIYIFIRITRVEIDGRY